MQREVVAAQHEAAKDELYLRLAKARHAAKAFFLYQDAEAKRHGYKSHCEFAHLIANGTVRSPPFVDVGELEIVSKWYHALTEVNRFALTFQFDSIHGGIPWERMLHKYRHGWNRNKFKKRIENLLRDLGGRL